MGAPGPLDGCLSSNPGLPSGGHAAALRAPAGQATILLLAVVMALLLGAVVLGGVASRLGARGDEQEAADLAALAGARAMHDAFPRLFEAPSLVSAPGSAHLQRSSYLDLGRAAAGATARRNGAAVVEVSFPDGGSFAPVRIRVKVRRGRDQPGGGTWAEAQLAPPAGSAAVDPGAGDYRGPFAFRQGRPMRPDVAIWFDRMAAAASSDGLSLMITSAFRTDAEQAILFARHPDPRWVAPPGRSLHRLGTELDLGPPGAYPWLAHNAGRFHFVQRYSWEPWHYGLSLNAGTASVGFGGDAGDGAGSRRVVDFAPPGYGPLLARAAQRWNVAAALLSAQLYVRLNINPFASVDGVAANQGEAGAATADAGSTAIQSAVRSSSVDSGALPISVDPAVRSSSREPAARSSSVDSAARSISVDSAALPISVDADAHQMRDLLRRFGAVPLALAAFAGGPDPVAACGCVPSDPATRGYVARVLGLLGGVGEPGVGGGLDVRLVS